MNRKKLFLAAATGLFSLFFSCAKSAQEPEKNNFLPANDSVYIAAQELLYSDPLTAREMLEKKMLRPTPADSLDWYTYYNMYIKTFLVTSELDSALPLSSRTEWFCTRQADPTPRHYYLLNDTYNNIGNYYSFTSRNDSALKYFKKLLDYSHQTHDGRVLATAYANVADAYLRLNDFDQSASYYRRMLYIADSLKLPGQELVNIYMGLGQTYMELRNFELSHHYFALATPYFDQMDLNRKYVYFTNHGNVYYYEGKYPEALELFRKGYEALLTSPEYVYPQNILRMNMGEIFLLMGQLDSARIYLEKSTAYFEANNPSVLYHARTQLFELATQAGNVAEATRLLSLMKHDSCLDPSLIAIRRKYMQHYYEKTGDYRNAYHFLKENMQTDDSTRNERLRMNVAETELRYRQDTTLMKQQLFIQEQQSDMKSLRMNVYIWILASGILLLSVLFIYFFQKKKRALLLAETRNKIITLRMENIRNRVSPHFIFNTLNRVVGRYDEADRHARELYNLIKIMRLNLRLTEKLCITLEEEIDFVRTYLTLERERFGDELEIFIHIDPAINPNQVMIPSMMIQIPVENALKHGLRNKEGEKWLAITLLKKEKSILIQIEDNGTGFHLQPDTHDMQNTGTGLKVINQTIQLLNAGNTESIEVEIKGSHRGTPECPGCLVEFILPDNYSYTLPEGK